ncbi:MAG: PhzF family phenazine biosynthesis protein [Gallicola sp.]|nr:PhzF family phenazine biosynthesis protein [Gallicola sp.]
MKRKIYQVDAFTSTPFSGNPAGVMTDGEGLSNEQMMLIAKEMKLSETAFVFKGGEGYDVEVKFFTPTEEVDLCGHATIGTFSLLKELEIVEKETKELVQKTKAGLLAIRFTDDGNVLMRQADPVNLDTDIPLEKLCHAMGINIDNVGIEGVMELPEIWSTGLADVLLPIKSVEVLKKMAPLMNALSDLSNELGVTGVHAFTLEDGEIWCRNFAPACGIPEESATGTSNGALGACLHSKGWTGEDTLSFTSHQGDWMNSPSRIFVQVKGKDNPEVWVGGKAVTVIDGSIVIPE